MTTNRFSYPCRFKQREDGTYFIRFPDLPEAIVDNVEETELHRAAEKCLATVLYWRVTNEVEIPPPSQLRPGQLLIELGVAKALSDAVEMGRLKDVDADEIDAAVNRLIPPMSSADCESDTDARQSDGFVPIAVAAE